MVDLICRLCDRHFSKVPEGSVRVCSRSRNGVVWRFPGGTIHVLKKFRPKIQNDSIVLAPKGERDVNP